MMMISLIQILGTLLMAPFLLGLIHRTKAFFGGRKGQPLLQPYYDLWKLLQKGSVTSQTTTSIFKLGPIVGLTCVLTILTLIPFGGSPALLSFQGDLLLILYLFGLLRFFYVIAALDTGSSFEGMGASREVQFSALAEVALLLGFVALAKFFGLFSLSKILASSSFELWKQSMPLLGFIVVSFLIVFLTENARIPMDDPNTHLELTMIHEVMVLDHSGIDLAVIFYTSALKLWILGSWLIHLIFPFHTDTFWINQAAFVLGMFGLAIFVGILESIMARLRLLHVPSLLAGAGTLSFLAFLLLLRK